METRQAAYTGDPHTRRVDVAHPSAAVAAWLTPTTRAPRPRASSRDRSGEPLSATMISAAGPCASMQPWVSRMQDLDRGCLVQARDDERDLGFAGAG
jgi:hypothetical protein